MKKLWHLYFAKKWRKLDHPYKIIYTMYKQADFWLSMFGTSYVRKRFQYINFDLGHHCKSSEHNRWIKTNGNRYSFWNAYTRYIYAPKTSHQSGKNVALLWRMCIKLSTKNSQHASLWSTEFGAIGFTHPPTREKLNRLILADPLAGPRVFICLASLCWWCSFFLSSFLSLYTTTPLYHSGSTVR